MKSQQLKGGTQYFRSVKISQDTVVMARGIQTTEPSA